MGMSSIKCHKVGNVACKCPKSSWIRLEKFGLHHSTSHGLEKQLEAPCVAAKVSLDRLPGEFVYLLEKVVVESPSSAQF